MSCLLRRLLRRVAFSLLVVVSAFASIPAHAVTALTEDQQHVSRWNQFAERLYVLHKYQLQNHPTYKKSITGGYANHPEFYTEVSYYHSKDDRLLSRIQWETRHPDVMHSLAVYVYDKQGKLQRDYLAAYLPEYRNAPVQTLINLHNSDRELRAFRQFDASGNRIHEQCHGHYFGEPVMITLEDYEIPAIVGFMPQGLSQELYDACFSELSAEAGKYLDPLAERKAAQTQSVKQGTGLEQLSYQIERNPAEAKRYIQRARVYFRMQDFDSAVEDLNRAIRLDSALDEAYFWRGMARGRNGEFERGIADLTEYIQRVPDSSRAYTKRGVRYIWNGEVDKAQQDLLKAIELDRRNAEAHDDLGVIYAQQGEFKKAISHFNKVTEFDPSYQKAYHNLAMTHHIQAQNLQALQHIDKALALRPKSKNSLTLKAEILKAIGQPKQASVLLDRAELLPEENWSEQWPD